MNKQQYPFEKDEQNRFSFWEEEMRHELPINYFLFREAESFKVNYRKSFSTFYKGYHKAAYITKPISNIIPLVTEEY